MLADGRIDNRTLMDVACSWQDLPSGHEALVVIAKATWLVAEDGSLQLPMRPEVVRRTPDVRAGTVRYPHDLAPVKPGTEVIVVGTALPPKKDAVRTLVSIRVATGDVTLLDKQLHVFGPRTWMARMLDVVPGDPLVMEPTPLTWENTYGGRDEGDDEIRWEPRNPVGFGFAHDRNKLVGQRVPPIEAPNAPLSSATPAPAGCAAIAAGWEPRASRRGTMDAAWRRERSPLLPADFDPRHHCSAPDDQFVEGGLERDGEPVSFELLGVTPRPWRFVLPPGRPRIHCTIDDEETERRPRIDTVLVDADERRVELLFRSTFLAPRKRQRVRGVRVTYEEPLDPAYIADLARRMREARHPLVDAPEEAT